MPTLIYSPQVRVYIQTDHDGTLDISEDLTRGDMVRRSDGVSTFNFGVMNARRKYDLKFTPNDRIVVLMKRLTWVHTFTGYLNSVPLRTAWPREVSLTASCSLKRLQYYYWDPYASATYDMLIGTLDTNRTAPGQGAGMMGDLIINVLTKVTHWPLGSIHLGQIPSDWFKLAQTVAAQIKAWSDDAITAQEDYLATLGSTAVLGGTVVQRIQAAMGLNGTDPTTGTSSLGQAALDSTGADSAPSSGGYSGAWAPVFNSATPRGDQSTVSSASGRPVGGAARGLLKPGTYGGIDLSQQQLDVAARIYELVSSTWVAGKAKINLPNQALWAAFATAMGESHFDPNAANNKANPGHYVGRGDGTPGNPSSALGVFQLLDTHGTVAQRRNVDFSTAWFVNSMLSHFGGPKAPQNLLGASPGRIALITQGSNPADGSGYYDQFTPMAKALTTAFNKAELAKGGGSGLPASAGGNVSTANGGTKRATATGTDLVSNLLGLLDRYPNIPYGRSADYRPDRPAALDCSELVMWGLYHTLGRLAGCPPTSYTQASWCSRISVSQALNTPGALLFVSSNGKATGAHHVAVSVGNGKDVIQASRPGVPAKKRPSADASYPWGWSFGGLIPALSYSGEGTPSAVSPSTPVFSGGTNRWPTKDHSVDVKFGAGAGKGTDGWYSAGGHSGVDFVNVKYGDPVYAVDGGTVQVSGAGAESDKYGTYLAIRTGNTLEIYAHLSEVMVLVGDKVSAGQKIGQVGNSGNVLPKPSGLSDHTTGVGLHFEVRQYPFTADDPSVLINPVTFIKTGVHVTGASDSGSAASGSGSGSGATGSTTVSTYADSGSYDPSSSIDSLFADQSIADAPPTSAAFEEAAQLSGAYTLANDSTVLQYLSQLCASSMRSFCSAPNGDFISWFPDYYGLWGTAAILRVEAIELQDFNVTWDDSNMVTHQFVQYSNNGSDGNGQNSSFDPTTGLITSSYDYIFAHATSAGLANIDSPSIMATLFGFPPENAHNFAQYVYQKFGARPNTKQVPAIMTSKSGEFFMALFYFMLQWAYQYSASVPTTFMPEAWPGMLLQVPAFNFQAYIVSVEHSFSFGEGGSFSTAINICAPALIRGGAKKGGTTKKGGNALLGLPLAGGYGNTGGLLAAADQSLEAPVNVTISPNTQKILDNS